MDGEDLFASSAFVPLPFRVLLLVGLGIICWATNLHILHRLGIDTSSVFETRTEKIMLSTPPTPRPPLLVNLASSSPPLSPLPTHLHPPLSRYPIPHSLFTPSKLYPPIYRLFLTYAAWVLSCYSVFNLAVNGDMQRMDQYRSIIALASIAVVGGLFCPFNVFQRRERELFMLAVRRCLFVSTNESIHFSDVILADIFTSFAKVLGDVYVSAYMILPWGSLKMSALQLHGLSEWIIPALISLPYIVRFRQCIAEYNYSNQTNTRSLLNALKYATSFPVIFLSAMQRYVIPDVNSVDGTLHKTWYGENQIFRLWFLSVCISSLYSFWWDVTNDWGLDLLRPAPTNTSTAGYATPNGSFAMSRQPSNTNLSDMPQSHLLAPSHSSHSAHTPKPPRPHPYGLRAQLLYGSPFVYYVAITLNFILRFTWSMKLSTHLHTFAELETGVFVVEACELLRRWLWVFFRVEWEACKKGMVPDVPKNEVEMSERS
ncbi:hypothetical protein FRB99_006100 [Tulasnella sp. 403]|nr:hypothetical protein FRB99_006100 [Tulasnella sp. 403]